MEQLSSKQASILIFLSVIALKAVVLPAVIYFFAGIGGYVTVFMALGFDFLLLLVYLWIMKKNPNQTFFDIISASFGKIFAKIVMFILFLYFILKTFLVMKSAYNFFVQVVYDELNWIHFLLATIFFVYYVLQKRLRVFGRCGEVLFWLIFISINFVLLISSINMDITRVLPFMPNGIEPVALTGLKCAYAFGDYTILVFLMGNIKYESKTNKQITTYAIMAISTILNLFIVFLCTFGYSVINQNLAIADLSLYIDFASTVSRLEWIAVFSWTITLIIQLVIYAYCTKSALDHVMPKSFVKHTAKIIVVALAIAYCIQGITMQRLVQFLLSDGFGIFSIITQVGIPLLLTFAFLKSKKRRRKGYVRLYSKTN